MAPADLRITKWERTPDGYYRARVSSGGATIDVHDRFGSWLADVRIAPGRRTFTLREVLPPVAAVLAAKRRAAERNAGRGTGSR